jgi:trehalose 6-phosphate phosphatase
MRHVLAARQRSILATFASSNTLVALDFDGTLAPITNNPSRARMRPATRRLLAAVARRYPTAVISGRARADLKKCLDGVAVAHLSGNHGLEPWSQGDKREYLARVRRWAGLLERRLAGHEGVVVEDKRFSVAVHYRNARRRHRAAMAIDDAVRSFSGARIFGGHLVVNIVPKGAPHKGVALERVRSLLGCDAAIYVGDDVTDEDVFQAANDQRLLAVRVGRQRASHAPYFLVAQHEIDPFLEALVALRRVTGRP